MIPKIIWQTHEVDFENLPKYIKECAQTFKDLNPEWDYRYCNAEDRERFIIDNFGYEWYQLFMKVPFPVMRADIWKYMVIYVYGGVYSDIDNVCKVPIDSWIKDGYDMVIGPDDDFINFAQNTFSAAPNSPILKNVIDVLKENLDNPVYKNKYFVLAQTGPWAFTKGVRRALEYFEDFHLIEDYKKINDLPKAKEYKFYCYGADNSMMFHKGVVWHMDGRVNWHDGDLNWLKQSEEFLKKMEFKNGK